MNAADLYSGTKWDSDDEADEDESPSEFKARVEAISAGVLRIIAFNDDDPNPEESSKDAFLARPPALGLSQKQVQSLRKFDAASGALARDSKRVFEMLRSRMTRQCVSCDGASTITALADALDAERAAGVASKLPTWYKFSDQSFGPRRLGLRDCSARGCFRTETETLKMKRCAQCSVPHYCGKEHQAEDWRLRHKHVCAKAKHDRDSLNKASEMLNFYSSRSEGPQLSLNDRMPGGCPQQ